LQSVGGVELQFVNYLSIHAADKISIIIIIIIITLFAQRTQHSKQ